MTKSMKRLRHLKKRVKANTNTRPYGFQTRPTTLALAMHSVKQDWDALSAKTFEPDDE